MRILSRTGGIAATNCYLIADEKAGEAAIFDAPDNTVAALIDQAAAAGWRITHLLLTHGHFDHVADHPAVARLCPEARVAIGALDEPKLMGNDPASRMFLLPFRVPPRKADLRLSDGDTVRIGGLEFQVMHTPGHSEGHVVYYCARERILVGGDLIIQGAIGRTDFPDSDWRQMNDSLRRVMALPPQTRLLPGHGDESTLEDEKHNNPYVQEAI